MILAIIVHPLYAISFLNCLRGARKLRPGVHKLRVDCAGHILLPTIVTDAFSSLKFDTKINISLV